MPHLCSASAMVKLEPTGWATIMFLTSLRALDQSRTQRGRTVFGLAIGAKMFSAVSSAGVGASNEWRSNASRHLLSSSPTAMMISRFCGHPGRWA